MIPKFMCCKLTHSLLILCLSASGIAVAAQEQSSESQAQVQLALAVQVKQYAFNLKPGGSFTFALPNIKSPIRIEISTPTTNGGVQTPSEVMWALVNKDSGNGQVTWVGTNSDGTTSGSNSLQNKDIANITCGPGCTIASLVVANATAGTLSVTQNAATTSITGSYIVRLYY